MPIFEALRWYKLINEFLKKLKEVKPLSPKTINIITNVLGILLVVSEPARSYLISQPFRWDTFLITIGTAVVAWFTGKSAISLQKGGVK